MWWILVLTWILCMLMVWIYGMLIKPQTKHIDRQKLRKNWILRCFLLYILIFTRFGLSPEIEASLKTILLVFLLIVENVIATRKST